MICPCCKANNDSGPACRRCKADLSLLFAFEKQNTPQHAVAALIAGDYATALKFYEVINDQRPYA